MVTGCAARKDSSQYSWCCRLPRRWAKAGWKARADRVILAAVGGEDYKLSPNTLHPTLQLAPGETKTLWLIRPYRVYESMMPELRQRDWAQEFARRRW